MKGGTPTCILNSIWCTGGEWEWRKKAAKVSGNVCDNQTRAQPQTTHLCATTTVLKMMGKISAANQMNAGYVGVLVQHIWCT